jgi:hypothetical protein
LVVQFAITLETTSALREQRELKSQLTLHFRCLHTSQEIGLKFTLSRAEVLANMQAHGYVGITWHFGNGWPIPFKSRWSHLLVQCMQAHKIIRGNVKMQDCQVPFAELCNFDVKRRAACRPEEEISGGWVT